MITIGSHFPHFALSDQDGNLVSLTDLSGHKSVLFFYPKDDTSGCTLEACAFRDALSDFGEFRVYGISPDSAKSHTKFVQKHGLNYPLLVDEGSELCTQLGIWVEKSMYGKKYMGVERTTFALDESGIVTHKWAKVKPEGHVAEVLKELNS